MNHAVDSFMVRITPICRTKCIDWKLCEEPECTRDAILFREKFCADLFGKGSLSDHNSAFQKSLKSCRAMGASENMYYTKNRSPENDEARCSDNENLMCYCHSISYFQKHFLRLHERVWEPTFGQNCEMWPTVSSLKSALIIQRWWIWVMLFPVPSSFSLLIKLWQIVGMAVWVKILFPKMNWQLQECF